jgi:hypothetical protein
MTKIKKLLSNLIRIKLQDNTIAYFRHLEEEDKFKPASTTINFSDSTSESDLLEQIIKDFCEELFYIDIHKKGAVHRVNNSFGLEKPYIRSSNHAFEAWSKRTWWPLIPLLIIYWMIFLIFRILCYNFLGIKSLLVYDYILIVIGALIGVVWLLYLCLSTFLLGHWVTRRDNYQSVSFVLNKLSIKITSCEHYLDRLNSISKKTIKDVEKKLSCELREKEREFDLRLETAYLWAILGFCIILAAFGISLKEIEGTLIATIGFGSFVALISFIIRIYIRKNRAFQIYCLEQILLLLQFAQNDLETRD